mmetsp:Transcript_21130/g.30549  ORF Transcript_21130/g.30549 Transcript_21130/m.30549 type:complete len:280 (-) Transcript_21130:81-920(-)
MDIHDAANLADVEESYEEQSDSDDSSVDEENQDDSSMTTGGMDGMADMMAKILHQQVPGKKIPVLAKRKTAIMKELEEEFADRDRLKRLRAQRKLAREKHIVIPDVSTADYERQLRKVATRGVVALFNAITKSKRQESEKQDEFSSNPTAKKSKTKDVMELSRSNFLSLLKADTTSNKNGGNQQSGETEDSRDDKTTTEAKSSSWAALKDDYLTDKKLALKDWDQDESDEESNNGSENELEDPFNDSGKRKSEGNDSSNKKQKTAKRQGKKGSSRKGRK